MCKIHQFETVKKSTDMFILDHSFPLVNGRFCSNAMMDYDIKHRLINYNYISHGI